MTEEVKKIIEDYLSGGTINELSTKYHMGKKKFRSILLENGVELKKSGGQKKDEEYIVPDWRIEKYPEEEGYEYFAVQVWTGFETKDYMNQAGVLTTMIKENGIEIPSLYDRRKYYMKTGNYWWEQWFRIEKRKKPEVKKCPYCDWETVDVENKSGWFQQHLLNEHGITPEEHLKKYPEDAPFFAGYEKKMERETKLKKEDNYVICPICGKRLSKITESHLKYKHNMTMKQFNEKYPDSAIMSVSMDEQIKDVQKYCNLYVSKNRFISSYEKEISDLLTDYGIPHETNRQILEGREIDILVPSKKIGIEFDGLRWHSEQFGKKSHTYHLEKTELCNRHGYGLIHVFEDEYVNSKELVQKKILHILGVPGERERIMARKCEVREIYKSVAEEFLNKNHIQGYSKSSVYYGAFYKEELIAVMSFLNGSFKSPDWELSRFATSDKYICPGVGGKLFKHFLRDYDPDKVVSFADRRWTVDIYNNLYTKLGFSIEKILPPDYRYYNEKVDKFKRVHKMTMNKKKLSKKYGLPMEMTEKEMATSLGYDRIWDCGLVKYAYVK